MFLIVILSLTVSASGDEVENRFSYSGKEIQDETGLYYFEARFYDPDLGRFISPDPAGGMNHYTYCANNPYMYVDPSGETIIMSQELIDTYPKITEDLQHFDIYQQLHEDVSCAITINVDQGFFHVRGVGIIPAIVYPIVEDDLIVGWDITINPEAVERAGVPDYGYPPLYVLLEQLIIVHSNIYAEPYEQDIHNTIITFDDYKQYPHLVFSAGKYLTDIAAVQYLFENDLIPPMTPTNRDKQVITYFENKFNFFYDTIYSNELSDQIGDIGYKTLRKQMNKYRGAWHVYKYKNILGLWPEPWYEYLPTYEGYNLWRPNNR